MFKHLFRLDLRSLALARVLLGLLGIYDIGRRIPEIDAFFTDGGIMSRAEVIESAEITWRMTLLNLNGSYEFALLLAIIGLIACVTFTLGWKTRISNLIIWLVIASFQARFPEISTSGGDMLVRIFFFWSLFLPMSAVYSFDHAVTGEESKQKEYFSVFTTIWIMQVFALYFFTFIYKWAPVYHTDFNAVWYMLQLELYTTPFGQWMGKQYMLTKFLSAACYLLELVGPLMLLIPWKRDMWRSIAVLSFWGFHLGIAATMYLGNFVPICLIIWVALIPTSWWNYLGRKIKTDSGKLLTLYHDSESAFARQLGLITKEIFFVQSLKVCPFPLKKQGLINEQELFILEDSNSKNYIKGLSLLSVLLQNSLFPPFRSLGKILSSDFSAFLSEAREVGGVSISENIEVKTEGKKSKFLEVLKNLFEILGFDKVKYQLNKFERFMGGLLLVLVLGWNVEGVIEDRDWYIGSPFDEIMFTFQLNQGWAMFAPHPQRSDGWWVMEGTLRNGEKWDALNNKEVSFVRPDSFYKTFPTENWRNLLDGLQGREEVYVENLARYLCRRWNSKNSGDNSLETFKLYYMEEWTKGPQEKPSPIEKRNIWNHSCF
jgi:hypothetical protein